MLGAGHVVANGFAANGQAGEVLIDDELGGGATQIFMEAALNDTKKGLGRARGGFLPLSAAFDKPVLSDVESFSGGSFGGGVGGANV